MVTHEDGDKMSLGKFITYVKNCSRYLLTQLPAYYTKFHIFSYKKYDLENVSRVGLATVLDLSPYVLVYDLLEETFVSQKKDDGNLNATQSR